MALLVIGQLRRRPGDRSPVVASRPKTAAIAKASALLAEDVSQSSTVAPVNVLIAISPPGRLTQASTPSNE